MKIYLHEMWTKNSIKEYKFLAIKETVKRPIEYFVYCSCPCSRKSKSNYIHSFDPTYPYILIVHLLGAERRRQMRTYRRNSLSSR